MCIDYKTCCLYLPIVGGATFIYFKNLKFTGHMYKANLFDD